VRRCIEVQRELDEKVARRIRGSFEEVLGELKVAGPQEAALKWRVLGIVVGKRREKLEEVVLEILRVRMGVSKGLVDLVDVLGESE
jgi:ribosomal protein L13E